jgi:hypothetical protein
MLLLAALAIVAIPDWVPARWFSKDPATLKLVESTPVNCLLMEKADWSPEFTRAAAERGIATLGIVSGNGNAEEIAAEAKKAGLTGLAVEGSLGEGNAGMPVVELRNRAEMKFPSDAQVSATGQGMWPGLRVEQLAAPTGPPWIDTNTGFLRYARVSTHAAIWIANRVPPKKHLLATAYLAAIGDAGMTGARWVLDFDEEFARGLAKSDASALKNWALMVQHVKFYEDHKEWRGFSMRSDVAHSKMVVNVAAELLTADQKEVLKLFMKAGGAVFNGPPGWRFPSPQTEQITLEKKDLAALDLIWEEVSAGPKNLGARLFNVGSVLSNLLESPDGKQVALHLVNYSDYPAADITIHVLGKFTTATLMRPEAAPQKLDVYEVGGESGVDVPALGALGTLMLER